MPLWVNGYLTRGHVAIITETESTYIMIESTLQFDDLEVIPGLLPLLPVVQRSLMWSREWSRRWPGNEAIPYPCSQAVGETAWQHLQVQTAYECNIMAIAISHSSSKYQISARDTIFPVDRTWLHQGYWQIAIEMEWAWLWYFNAWRNWVLLLSCDDIWFGTANFLAAEVTVWRRESCQAISPMAWEQG